MSDQFGIKSALQNLGIKLENLGTSTGQEWINSGQDYISSYSPADGALIGKVQVTDRQSYELVISKSQEAFQIWRTTPAPKRGEIVRQMGNALREVKADLGKLVSYEMGKSYQEGLGEVQEMIDICDFAVGLSRQLYGLTMHSERPGHRMYEQWHPIGVVGIISAFNFPVAVWSWNSMIAWVCGDVCIWKPSEKAPLSGVACQHIISKVLKENNLPEGISGLIVGDYKVGQMMTEDTRVPLISATGSTRNGKNRRPSCGGKIGKVVVRTWR
jgi:aldehyde dehydrogenase (NAD+)